MPLFVTKGYSSTTIMDIRKASGATTGSIYHFFEGKPGIAVALWESANDDWQKRTTCQIGGGTPKEMVQASVKGLAEWALADRALFLFYEDMRIRALTTPELKAISDTLREGFDRGRSIYKTWVEAGAVRDMPWPLASALMLGPTYDYLRKCGDRREHRAVVRSLAELAWQAIKP